MGSTPVGRTTAAFVFVEERCSLPRQTHCKGTFTPLSSRPFHEASKSTARSVLPAVVRGPGGCLFPHVGRPAAIRRNRIPERWSDDTATHCGAAVRRRR